MSTQIQKYTAPASSSSKDLQVVTTKGNPPQVVVRLLPESGAGAQAWTGRRYEPGRTFDFQLLFHGGMEPGGVLFRDRLEPAWSSLNSTSAKGTEGLRWPENWRLGCAQSGGRDRPFVGANLNVRWTEASLVGPFPESKPA